MSKNIRAVVQCCGRNKSGNRCKRRTARTPLCYQHLEKEQHLRVKKSQIAGAGMGLYTTVRRPPHRMVAPYTGSLHESNEDQGYGGDYVIQLNNRPPYKFVDAQKTTEGAGRFSNMARRRDHFTNNAHLTADPKTHMAKVVSNERPIAAGREIYTKYGNAYW